MKQNAKRVFLVLLAVVFLICAIAPVAFAETTVTMKMTAEFFSRPIADSEYYVKGCDLIPAGATVTIITSYAKFSYVSYNGYKGYVENSMMDTPTTTTTTTTTTTDTPASGSSSSAASSTQYGITKEKVYFRIQPKSDSSSSNRVSGCSSIASGETVVINSMTSDGDWYNITYKGYTGYARVRDINTNVSTIGSSSSSSSASSGTATPTGSSEVAIPSGLSLSDAQAKIWKSTNSLYSSAKAKNSDTVGWIYVPGTGINHPIMFSQSWYYANHTPEKASSSRGSVYAYSSGLCNITAITAHNMRGTAKKSSDTSKWMFHELHHIRCALQGRTSCDYCGKSCNGQTATIFNITMGNYHSWQVISMYEAKGQSYHDYNCFNQNLSGESLQAWINKQISSSVIKFNVNATSSDKIMVLVTCGKSSGNSWSRFYTILKAIG